MKSISDSRGNSRSFRDNKILFSRKKHPFFVHFLAPQVQFIGYMYGALLRDRVECARININLYIGLVVEIKTTYGEKVTGEIFCYDEQRKTVVLSMLTSPSRLAVGALVVHRV